MTPEELQKDYDKTKGVEYDIGKRWENGIAHNHQSELLMDKIKKIDFIWNDDHFCWKTGGDGDNGEALMYVLDIIFDEREAKR